MDKNTDNRETAGDFDRRIREIAGYPAEPGPEPKPGEGLTLDERIRKAAGVGGENVDAPNN